MKKIISILLLSLLITSCSRAVFMFYDKKDPHKKRTTWAKDDREIIHIPMIHLAKQEYYDKVKVFVEEKRKEGYTIYYEGVANGTTNKEELDTLYLKIRKILGFHFGTSYNDTTNKSLPKRYKKYIGQTLTNTGIDTLTDINADMNMKQLIEKLERGLGEKIVLGDCDFKTPLKAKYKCKSKYRKYRYNLTRQFRDDYLSDLLINAPHKKIVVLYGAAHRWFVYSPLHRAGFRLKEGKWFDWDKEERKAKKR